MATLFWFAIVCVTSCKISNMNDQKGSKEGHGIFWSEWQKQIYLFLPDSNIDGSILKAHWCRSLSS